MQLKQGRSFIFKYFGSMCTNLVHIDLRGQGSKCGTYLGEYAENQSAHPVGDPHHRYGYSTLILRETKAHSVGRQVDKNN